MRYVLPHKSLLAFTIVFSVLFGLLSALTMAVIQPVLQVLFDQVPTSASNTVLASTPFEEVKQKFFGWLTGLIVDTNKTTTLLNLSSFIVGMFMMKNLVKYFNNMLYTHISEVMSKAMRNHLYEKMLSLSMDFFNKQKAGDLISLITNDLTNMHNTLLPFLVTLVRNPVEILLLLTLLLAISPFLTLVSFSTSIVTLVLIKFGTKYLRKYANRMADATAGFVSVLHESLVGIRIVKAFVGERFMLGRFNEHTSLLMRSSKKLQRVNDAIPALNEMLAIVALSVVLYIGGSEVFAGNMSGSELMTFLFALFAIMSPISALTSIPAQIQRGVIAAERVFTIHDTVSSVEGGSKVSGEFSTELRMENVSFAYNQTNVLNSVSLVIPKGKTVALVGASGSGKSTCVDLLVRFYDAQSGSISIDGTSIKDYQLESYRSHFGIVSQEPILFNDTISANIAFGKPNASQDFIRECATIAHAHEFISNLPQGYNTVIGDRGVMLSGGQRQRIAIARALAVNPDILIFDEATSALDSESEKIVQQAITDVLKNRTAVIIAHRLSTIINADTIVVFDKGVIVEQGTHEELLQNNGVYKKLYEIQYGEGT